jgi:hypothetical protein
MREKMTVKQENQKKPRSFKTPKSKLVRFFKKSRDQWKTKTKDAKYQIKLLRKKIKYMEHNKKEYKATIINQARQIEQMQEEIERLKKNLNL